MKSSSRHRHTPSLASSFFAAMLRPAALLIMLLLLAACANNNSATSAARVEIVQTGLLFTERGQTRQLSARVFDAAGVPIDTPVRWSSSDETNISVASNGTAMAERSSGSTQIIATVGEVHSAPLLAVVTTVAPGTVLVSDEQIARGVVESDPNAPPSLDNTYTVVVSGIALPAVDTLMVGTGSAPVAGRVVSAREVPGGVEVTLKLAPISVLFPGLEINQRFNLADVPATIPESVSAEYAVQREGNTYTFTPLPEARAAVAKAGSTGTRVLLQGCEGTVNGVGLGDGAAPPLVFEPQPVFKFTINPALDVVYTQSRGLERFVVTAEPTFLIDGTVKATAAFEGKVSCKAELLIFPVPVGGALSVVISGLVPVGVGFELAGKVTVAQLKLGLKSRTSANAALGLSCESECTFVNELTDFVNTNTPTVDVPGLDDFRIKPELTAFGYVEAVIGNRFFKSLQFRAFEVKAGPKLEGEFAPLSTQIAAADFKSNYKLSLVVNAGFGDDIESVLNILGVVEVGNEVLEKAVVLAVSPTGVLTADRDRFVAGDTVKFELKLDPVAVKFLGLYNIKEIVLIRKNGLREIARVAASGEQTTFNFTFIAPDEGSASEFTAFAVTALLPANVLSLELDSAREPATGLASLQVTRVRVSSFLVTRTCNIQEDCNFSNADKIDELRDYDETTGIPDADQTALDARNNFGKTNVSAETEGGFAVNALTGTTSQIVLRCNSSGEGTGPPVDDNNVDYGLSALSYSDVSIKIKGEDRVRYKMNIDYGVGGTDLFTGTARAIFQGRLREVFGVERRHEANELHEPNGSVENSGFLEAGRDYTLSIECKVFDEGDDGGSAHAEGVVRLILSPE